MNIIVNSIDSLIEKLEYIKIFNTNIASCIFNIDMFISSLKDLNNMIGIESVKKSIIIQVKYIIFQKFFMLSDNNISYEHNMLHTVIYGPPGVGKSQIGIILCKIWMSLGIIKINYIKSYVDPNIIVSNIHNKLISIINNDTNINSVKLELNYIIDYIQKSKENQDLNDTIPDLNPENYIKIVNRDDFISGYLGQTSHKTKKLLNECRGKILFIDESYSLINGEKDSYGQEAITVLNEFMSKYPGEIIIIFAGYKNKLDETLFNYQPGLRRRFKWNFDIDSYTPNELASIFKNQILSNGWSIEFSINIVQFFIENISYFPSFGGDTLKLCYDCKLCHSEYIFNNNFQLPNKIISNDSFKRGYRLYLDNFISNNNNHDFNNYNIYI